MKKLAVCSIFSFIFIVTLLSCESSFKDVQRINTVEFTPAAETEDINLKYTDSGRVKAILRSPLMLDYSNLKYKFNEFPEGINVTLLDDKGNATTIIADYAVSYDDTDIIDLQGNVVITAQDGKKLETEQLYYNQKTEWFYTEKKFKFTDADGFIEGPGIDFSRDFKIVNAQRNTGQIDNIKE